MLVDDEAGGARQREGGDSTGRGHEVVRLRVEVQAEEVVRYGSVAERDRLGTAARAGPGGKTRSV